MGWQAGRQAAALILFPSVLPRRRRRKNKSSLLEAFSIHHVRHAILCEVYSKIKDKKGLVASQCSSRPNKQDSSSSPFALVAVSCVVRYRWQIRA